MKTAVLGTIALFSMTLSARADFSYTITGKTTGGSMAGMAGNANGQTTKMYFKGQKLKSENADLSTIMDFEAQTLTTINHRTKTVTVAKLGDVIGKAGDAQMKIDVKETGQQKTINGYNAKELLLTMEMEMPQGPQMGKMQVEMELWLSPDVPGNAEAREFYRKNAERFPWASMAGGNPQLTQAVAQMQRRMAEMNGVQVETVMKFKPAGGAGAQAMPQMPQMTAAQQAQMQAAMARMQQQGGPGAEAAAQMMARMGNMGRGGAPASNSLMEITTDATEFSTAPIPDSVFAIPAGYQKN